MASTETDQPAIRRQPTWVDFLTQHPVMAWSNEDVQAWLVRVGLAHLRPVFVKFTGPSLLALTDRLVDELFNNHNPAIKALGNEYEVADKINFKIQFDALNASTPFVFKCYRFVSSTFTQLPSKIQNELVTKISSRTVETMLKYVAFGAAAVATTYAATSWTVSRIERKKE